MVMAGRRPTFSGFQVLQPVLFVASPARRRAVGTWIRPLVRRSFRRVSLGYGLGRALGAAVLVSCIRLLASPAGAAIG